MMVNPEMKRLCLSDMRQMIIFLIRKKLGLGKYENFKFTNQKSDAVYYFTKKRLMKRWNGQTTLSNVSLNWLLDNDCKIEKGDA